MCWKFSGDSFWVLKHFHSSKTDWVMFCCFHQLLFISPSSKIDVRQNFVTKMCWKLIEDAFWVLKQFCSSKTDSAIYITMSLSLLLNSIQTSVSGNFFLKYGFTQLYASDLKFWGNSGLSFGVVWRSFWGNIGGNLEVTFVTSVICCQQL